MSDQKLNITITADGSQASSELNKVGGALGNLSGDAAKVKDPLDKVTASSEDLTGVLEGLPGPAGEVVSSFKNIVSSGNPLVIALTLAVTAFAALTTASIKAGTDVAATAKQVDTIQKASGAAAITALALSKAFESVGGSANDATDVLTQVAGSLADANSGNRELAQGLKALGVTDLSNLDKSFNQLIDSFKRTDLSLAQINVRSQVLGEQGVKQAAAIAGGYENIKQKIKDYGLELDETTKKQAGDFTGAVADSKLAFDALETAIAKEVLPTLTSATKNFNEFVLALAKSETVIGVFKSFAGTISSVISSFSVLQKTFEDTKTSLTPLIDGVNAADKNFTTFRDTILNSIPGFQKYRQALRETSAGFDAIKPSALGTAIPLLGLFESIGKGNQLYAEQIELQKQYEASLKKAKPAIDGNVISQKQAEDQLTKLKDKQAQLLTSEKALADSQIAATQERVRRGVQSEQEAQVEIQGIRERLAQKELDLAANTQKTIQEFQQKGLNFTKERAEADNGVLQAGLARNQVRREDAAKTEAAILGDRDRAVAKIVDIEAKGAEEIQKQRNSGLIDEQTYNNKLTELSIKSLNDQVAADKLAKNQLIAQKNANVLAIQALDQKIADNEKKILEQEQQQKITLLQNQLANETAAAQAITTTRLTYIEQEKTALAQKIAIQGDSIDKDKLQRDQLQLNIQEIIATRLNLQELIPIREKELEILKAQGASQEAIKAKESEIGKLQADISQKRVEQLAAEKTAQQQVIDQTIRGLQSYAAELAKSTEAADTFYKKLLDGSLTIQSIKQTFDGTSKSVEEVQQHIKDLIADSQSLFLVNLNAAQSFSDAAEALQKDLDARLLTEAQKQAQANAAILLKAQQDRLALAERTAESLAKIERDTSNKLRDLKQQETKDLEQNNNDKLNEIESYERDSKQAAVDGAQSRKDLVQKLADEELAANQKHNNELLAQQEAFENAKSDLTTKATKDRNSTERQGLVTQAQIEAELKKVGNDPAKKAELEKQLKESQEATARAKRKEAEIKKAEEISGSKEELDARTSAIEEKYRTEEEGAKQLADLEKTGNKEAIERLKALLKEEAENEEKALADNLARIARDKALKQKQLDDETKARHDAQQKQLDDLDASIAKEQKARDEAHAKRLSDIDKQNKEIEAKYKTSRDAIIIDEKKSLEDLAKSAGLARNAFFDLLDGAESRAKKLAEALNIVNKAFSALPQPGSGGDSGSGGSGGAGGNGGAGGQSVSVGTTNADGSSAGSGGSFSTGLSSANITKQPPKNADNGQGAGAGTSKTDGQQPGSTGVPEPGSLSATTVDGMIDAIKQRYKDVKQGKVGKSFEKNYKAILDLELSVAKTLKLQVRNNVALVLTDDTVFAIAITANNLSNAICLQAEYSKDSFNRQLEALANAFNNARKEEEEAPGDSDTGGGKLAKGGDFNTPGGVGKGAGGGQLGGLTTSKIIKGAQSNPRSKGEDRSGLEDADRQATKEAQFAETGTQNFANNPDSKTGGFGTGANTRGDTTPINPSTPPTSPSQATIKAPVNFAPVLQFNIDPKSFSDTITKAIMQAAQDPSFARKLMNTFDQSTTLTSR